MATTRQRIQSIPQSPIGNGAHSTTKEAEEQSFPFQEECKSLGLLALIMLVVFIGFQMTTDDAYSTIDAISSTSSTQNANSNLPAGVKLPPLDPPIPLPKKGWMGPQTQTDPKLAVESQRKESETTKTPETQESITEINNPKDVDPPKYIKEPEMRSAVTPLDANGNPVTLISPPPPVAEEKENEQKPKLKRDRNKANGPMINIRSKKTPFDDSQGQTIPSIEEMIANTSRRFYSDIDTKATIYNYDTVCPSQCKGNAPKSKLTPFALIGGLYNTGTNVAYKIISSNCQVRMRFQPAWGKHEMPTLEKMEYWNGRDWENNYKGMYEENMIVFVIKDPLTWMKSMCKANYDFRYENKNWFFNLCPGGGEIEQSRFDWLPLNRGKIMNRGANKTSNGIYDSMIQLWSEWYTSLTTQIDGRKYPYLIVRFEDMLFRPQSVVTQFCECLGKCKLQGDVDPNHVFIQEEASKGHGNPRNRTMSFWSYSRPEYRYDGYTKEDLEYLRDHVNHTLLEMFGYEFDVEKTMRMRM